MKKNLKMLVSAMAFVMAGQAFGATNWLLTSATVSNGNYVYTTGGVTVTASAWADTNGSAIEKQIATGDSTGATGNFYRYSGGLGINNLDGCGTSSSSTCAGDAGDVFSAAPEHAIDNNQRNEMVLLSFSQAVNLSSVYFGWAQGDADFTLLAYDPTKSNSGLSGKSWATLDTGWQKISDYSATISNGTVTKSVSNSTYSSLWLIGAYNPLNGDANSAYSGADYFKLASVSGTTCPPGSTAPGCGGGNKVPEPGSLAMLGIGLLGLLRIRKVKKAD